MPQFPEVESFLLVGGKSSRMGQDKALLEIGGKPLLVRAASLIVPLVARMTLIGDPQKYASFGYSIVADKWPKTGPLGGIATALAAARKPWSIILACDLPYLTGDWLAWLMGSVTASGSEKNIDIFIPETSRGLEPLCAIYRSSCASGFAAALERGVRKVTDAFEGFHVERITEGEWKQFSPTGNLFLNLNTSEDYQKARAYLED